MTDSCQNFKQIFHQMYQKLFENISNQRSSNFNKIKVLEFRYFDKKIVLKDSKPNFLSRLSNSKMRVSESRIFSAAIHSKNCLLISMTISCFSPTVLNVRLISFLVPLIFSETHWDWLMISKRDLMVLWSTEILLMLFKVLNFYSVLILIKK